MWLPMLHNVGKMFYKEENFGNGAREGVACCESANNAVTGGTLIPTLTLGVPGNATTAILLGALTVHGLIPGYGLFTTQKSITYPFIAALFIANVIMMLIGLLVQTFCAGYIDPEKYTFSLCFDAEYYGSTPIRGNVGDVFVMLVFGVAGFFNRGHISIMLFRLYWD